MKRLLVLRHPCKSAAALLTVQLIAACGAEEPVAAVTPNLDGSSDAAGQGGASSDATTDDEPGTTDDTFVDDTPPTDAGPMQDADAVTGDVDQDAAASDVALDIDAAVDVAAPDTSGPPVWDACPASGFAEEVFRLPPELTEVSGLALATSGDFLWMHNDSGDSATLYGVDFTGAIVARWRLDVPAQDWEDMALGLCGLPMDDVCVFIGDIGDNAAARESVRVYRLPEPGRGEGDLTGVETMTVRYADGPRDAEALYVDGSGRVGIMSKEPGETGLYVGAFEAREVEWGRVATVDLSQLFAGTDELLTAADFDPQREALLIRSYSSLAGMDWPSGDGPAREGRWQVLPNGVELQAEAVAWGAPGYWHVAEGSRARVYRVHCGR